MVLLVGVPPRDRPEQREAAKQIVESMRHRMNQEADVYLEEDSEILLDKIEKDIASHPSVI